jgi:hypothetical protein
LARRLSTQEAAAELGITVDAVRKRAERGQLHSEREGNRLYILLDTDAPESGPDVEPRLNVEVQLLDELRDRLRYVERQLEAERGAHAEARRLLAAALERIPPQLEAPSQEPRESPETATEEDMREARPASGGAMAEGAQRPWWRRWFGG